MENKLKELLQRKEKLTDELEFQMKYTAKIAAIHQTAKDDVKHMKEVRDELNERIKKLESDENGL